MTGKIERILSKDLKDTKQLPVQRSISPCRYSQYPPLITSLTFIE